MNNPRSNFRSHRGGGGGHGRGGREGGRGGGNAGHGNSAQGSTAERKPPILDLAIYMDKKINVKFTGGREVVGTLKGYDQLMNLVLDEVEEIIQDEEGNQHKRDLGLVVCRGPLLTLISPMDGQEEIANPFLVPAE